MLLQSYTLTWSAKSLFQPTIGTSKYKALIGKSLKRSITHPTVKHRLYNWLNVIKIKHFQSFAILKSGCRRGTLYFLKDKHCVFVDPLNVFRIAEVLIDVLLEFSKRFLKLGNSVQGKSGVVFLLSLRDKRLYVWWTFMLEKFSRCQI